MKNYRLVIICFALAPLVGREKTDSDPVPEFEAFCDDAVGNDNDGSTDCDDADCQCEESFESACNNGLDDDDGWADCEDSDCQCEDPHESDCLDGDDNDFDGDIDCLDEDCLGDAACPVADEIYDDRIDNDLDRDIDCDDSDCPPYAACPGQEYDARECDDGIDNDFDGDTDCDDDGCEDACCDWRHGPCGPPEPPQMFIGVMSFVRSVHIPVAGSPECCFDYDNDGLIDNGAARLAQSLGVLIEDFDLNTAFAEAIGEDSFALLIELDRGADGNGFWAYLGTNDWDGDGRPDQTREERAAGDGVFQFHGSSIDEFGAIAQFNTATVDRDVTTAGPSVFRMSIPIETETFSFNLELTIEQATLQGALTDDETGVASIDQVVNVDGETVELGGWKLGGVIPLGQIGAVLDDLVSDCACAGFDADTPVITYGEDGTDYHLACAQSPEGECSRDESPLCENIADICQFIAQMPDSGVIDIDTDGNGVRDAMSVGLWLSAVGATLSEPPDAD